MLRHLRINPVVRLRNKSLDPSGFRASHGIHNGDGGKDTQNNNKDRRNLEDMSFLMHILSLSKFSSPQSLADSITYFTLSGCHTTEILLI